MTDNTQDLDEILTHCDFEPEAYGSRICKWCGQLKKLSIHTNKQEILQWVADEVIGDDESQIRSDGNKNTQEWTNGRNNQRQQQRNKLKSLGWKG